MKGSIKSLIKSKSMIIEQDDLRIVEHLSWEEIVKKYRYGLIALDGIKEFPEQITLLDTKDYNTDVGYIVDAYIMLPTRNAIYLLLGEICVYNGKGYLDPFDYSRWGIGVKILDRFTYSGCGDETPYKIPEGAYQKELAMSRFWLDDENLFKINLI